MPPTTEVLIGSLDDEHVLVQPQGRSQPGLFDSRDGNWIACDVEIAAGRFRASFQADLRSDEFAAFLAQASTLAHAREGAATFSTLEGQLALSLTTSGGDALRVEGEANDAAGSGNRLHFEFTIDQALLSGIILALEQMLAVFPVAGPAEAS